MIIKLTIIFVIQSPFLFRVSGSSYLYIIHIILRFVISKDVYNDSYDFSFSFSLYLRVFWLTDWLIVTKYLKKKKQFLMIFTLFSKVDITFQ
jgi:hypothetical protein